MLVRSLLLPQCGGRRCTASVGRRRAGRHQQQSGICAQLTRPPPDVARPLALIDQQATAASSRPQCWHLGLRPRSCTSCTYEHCEVPVNNTIARKGPVSHNRDLVEGERAFARRRSLRTELARAGSWRLCERCSGQQRSRPGLPQRLGAHVADVVWAGRVYSPWRPERCGWCAPRRRLTARGS